MKTEGWEKMRAGTPAFGTWLSLGSPAITELAARCGFDWLLFDLEHGCLNEAGLLESLRAANGSRSALIVRVPDHGASLIGRALDWGAHGIMVPHVETAEAALALARAMAYPPRGDRGFSRSVRVWDYGLTGPTDADPLLIVQIETAEGLRNVEEIAAVPGVHGLFVGPADLQLSLSVHPGSPSFSEALEQVADAARRHGLAAGILSRDPRDVPGFQKLGFTQIAVDSDLAVLRKGFQAIRAGLTAAN